jgi:hypothetical protein
MFSNNQDKSKTNPSQPGTNTSKQPTSFFGNNQSSTSSNIYDSNY